MMEGSCLVDFLVAGGEVPAGVDWSSITDNRDWMRLVLLRPELSCHCPCNKGWEKLPVRKWVGRDGAIAVVLLPQDILRTARSDPYGFDRYPYDMRVDLEEFRRSKGLSDKYDGLRRALWYFDSVKALSINGEEFNGDNEFDATNFVCALKAFVTGMETKVKIIYLEYLSGLVRCDWSQMGS